MKKLFFVVLACLVFASFADCDSAFNKIVRAMNRKATQLQLSTLVSENVDKPVDGKGYIVEVAETPPTGVVITLSTTRRMYSPYSISIKLYLDEKYAKKALKLRRGSFIRFSGTLKSVMLAEIVITNGEIKKHLFLFW